MSSPTVRRPSASRAPWQGLVSLALLASACGGHFVSRGSDLYSEGRLVEAAEVFERTEARLATSSEAEQARFGLYRGATFLKLGDVEHAARWLGYSRSVVIREPDALDREDLALLTASLKALASAKPLAPAPSDDAAVAGFLSTPQ